MSSRLLSILCALLLVVGLVAPVPAQQETPPAPPASLLVKMVPGLSAEQQAEVVARNGGFVRSVVPALRLYVVDVAAETLAETLARYEADAQVERIEENQVRVSEAIPSDPLYLNQWALPQIGWDQVFGTFTPAGTATVAVLDTGIDRHHRELADKVIPGISFLDGSDGRTDPSGHGTALAGIIAALTDTIPGDGIAGIGWAGVRVMPVTVLNADGEGQDGDIIAGVIWAADHGADVILMAFSNPGFSASLQEAIDYAWARGVVLVASTGNHGTSDPRFPAGHRGVMGTAATDQADNMAWWSSHGQAAFIAAPGMDIQTIDIGDAYAVFSGTSTSAAIVAGSAALLKAANPALPNGVIVYRLASTADPASTQEQTGNGRVNLARALMSAEMESIQPAGADPVGEGGPFVGPYRADTVTAVNLTSPTTASPATVTSLPTTVTVAFTYSSSGVAGTTAQARVVSGGTTIATSGAFQAVPTGPNQNRMLAVTIPAGTANGSYRIEVEVQNTTIPPGPASRMDGENTAVIVNVATDATAPVVSVSFPAPNGANGWFVTRPVEGSVTATDPSNVTAISCSGAVVGTIAGLGTPSATAPLTVDAEGTHNVSCTATDGASNSGAASGSTSTATVKVDTQHPGTTIVTNPANPTNATSATFTFTGTDPAPSSGGPTFQCALDGAPFTACASPHTYPGPLADGAHMFQVRAVDTAGNVDESPATYPWTIDTVPPVVTVTFPSPDGQSGWFVTKPVVGMVTATDDSNVSGITCTGATVGSITGTGTPSASAPLTLSAEGVTEVSCTATDGAGNTGAASGSANTATVKIDTQPPDTSLTGMPTNPTNLNTATFTFTGTDPVPGSGNLTFECELDGSGFAGCTSPKTYMGLADGVHTFRVRALDQAGNLDPMPASFTWTIDTTPPTVTVTFGAPNGSNGWFKSSPVVGTVLATDALSNVTAIACPGFAVGLLTGAGTPTASASVTVSAEGIHTVSCTATDSLGNSGAGPGSTSTATVKIDTVAPNVALDPGADSCSLTGNLGWCRGTQTAGFTAFDATSGLVGPASFTQSTTTNGSAVFIPSGPVCDVAGNCNPGINAGPYKIDSVAPTIAIGAPADGAIVLLNQAVASSYDCTDGTSGVASCAGPVASGNNIDTGTVGSKPFTVEAQDVAGNTSALTHTYHVQYASGGLCQDTPGHAILQPINPNGSSVFKQKSTVPAKFRVCDANGVSIGTPGVVAGFHLVQVIQGTVTTDVNEGVDSTTPHSAFRWDPTEQQWIFNIDTKPMYAGRTYVFRIWLDDMTTVDFRFGLR